MLGRSPFYLFFYLIHLVFLCYAHKNNSVIRPWILQIFVTHISRYFLSTRRCLGHKPIRLYTSSKERSLPPYAEKTAALGVCHFCRLRPILKYNAKRNSQFRIYRFHMAGFLSKSTSFLNTTLRKRRMLVKIGRSFSECRHFMSGGVSAAVQSLIHLRLICSKIIGYMFFFLNPVCF